jgi:hypothetical protein
MRNLYLICLFLLSFGYVGLAQTTATDFTSNDCAGNSQTLFTQLDADKVVVLVWVMPCGSCTGPAKTAYNIVQSYATSNPGKVVYWLIDENNNCTGMNNWATANSVSTNSIKFSNSAISQSPYGSSGMPKIVIAAGTTHKVYFNQNGSAAGNSTNLQAAINLAITETTSPTGISEKNSPNNKLSLFPNPASNVINIAYSLTKEMPVNLEVFNMLGEKVRTIAIEKQSAGKHDYSINVESLQNGVYYVKLGVENNSSVIKFNVSH